MRNLKNIVRSFISLQNAAAVLCALAAFGGAARADTSSLPTNVVLPTIERSYPTIQYKAPQPARRLYVADVQKLSHDEQTLLASLQGLVNRVQPRIYFIWNNSDLFWLNRLQGTNQTGSPIWVQDPLTLLQTFKDSYQGAVVADPKIYDSPCVAASEAGVYNLLLATPDLAAKYGIPIKEDLRGKFKDNADALRYERTDLLPHLNPYLLISIDPPLIGSQIDEIVAAKGIAFWVTGPKAGSKPGANFEDERYELAELLAQTPLLAAVHGYWWAGDQMGIDEGPGVSLASQYGKLTTVSDYVDNFSVLSGYTLKSVKQKKQNRTPKYNPNKVYLAITMTDGDNLSPWKNVYREYFQDPLRGTFPIGWGMGPTLIDSAPVMTQWFYDQATPNDEFICDVSGAGYINPTTWGAALANREEATKSYYDLTESYMKRLDMRTLRFMYVDFDEIAEVAKNLPDVQFFMPDYGYQDGLKYRDLTYSLSDGRPVFRALTNTSASGMADQIRKRVGDARPAFVNAIVTPWGLNLSDLRAMLTDLGPDYVAVTPSQLNELYRKAQPSR